MVVQLLSWAQRPVHVNWVIDPPISPTQLVLVGKAMVNLQAPDPIIAGSCRAIYIVVDDAREVGSKIGICCPVVGSISWEKSPCRNAMVGRVTRPLIGAPPRSKKPSNAPKKKVL